MGWSGKLRAKDKKVLKETLAEGEEWVEEYGKSASLEDLEEKLAELQSKINAVTSSIYQEGSGGGSRKEESEFARDGSEL